ncbi:IS21 family transposase [Caulobacter sp. X]|uniref:IS21 family transposase n=1 Tax=Caulobacter sp. X TaxID=2048901 RepID=UPI00137481BE|nr:IS21 family transposase [Caulobacter sp. X]
MFELQIMYKQGYSLKEISRVTGHSINTVRKYARDKKERCYIRSQLRISKLEEYKSYLTKRIREASPHWLPATVLYDEIKLRGYKGRISLLRSYLSTLKPKSKPREFIRFETEPGEQMQVDFAHFKFEKKIFYAFVATLGYSRMIFVRFVENQKIETLIQCHEDAFDYFGGVPKHCLYDNMKTIILNRNAFGSGKHRLHRTFYDFAKHCGFNPIVCKPYHPQTKGKVERAISYLRYSFYHPFIAGKDKVSLDELNISVLNWLNLTANQRTHATTKTIPMERWVIEKTYLSSLVHNYSTNYGSERLSITTNTLIMKHNTVSLQHSLSIYDALFIGGA